jgi:hypothetical protein
LFRRSAPVVAILVTALMALESASPASAAKPVKPQLQPPAIVLVTTATEAIYDPATGEVGDGQAVTLRDSVVTTLSSGAGGTATASGCKAVTLTNSGYSAVFGVVLFRHVTVTSWCWNRAAKSMSSIGVSYRLEDVSSTMYWRGEVNRDTGFYSWTSGYPTSGYHHYRQGSFENCVLKYGCIGIWYPSNDLRGHSDGTWTYTVAGADS